MSIELSRNSIKAGQLVANTSIEAVVEGDILVSDIKPDVERVLWIDGIVTITSVEVIQDRIIVEGAIDVELIYTPDSEENTIQHMDGSIAFDQYVDVPGVKPKMNCDVDIRLQYIDYELINERKLNIKSIMTIDVNVIDELQLEIGVNLSDTKDIEVSKDVLPLTQTIGSASSQTLVRQSIELPDAKPSIKELIQYKVKPVIEDFKVTDNKVAFVGTLYIFALYSTEDEEKAIDYIEDEINFEHNIEVPGAYVSLDCLHKVSLRNLSAEIRENPLGEMRVINFEAMVDIKLSLIEESKIEFISDVYSTTKALTLSTRTIKPAKYIGLLHAETIFNDTINIGSGTQVDKVYAMKGDVVATNYTVNAGRIEVEGTIRLKGLYSTAYLPQVIYSFDQEIAFKHFLEADDIVDKLIVKLDMLVRNISYNLILPDAVEVKGEVYIKGIAWEFDEKQVVLEIKESEQVVERPSGIIVYVVRSSDTLWNIAKKFGTTTAKIKKLNGLEDDTVPEGSKLLIYNNIPV